MALNHRAVEDFWSLYDALPKSVRKAADKNYKLLTRDPKHPSLHFKSVSGEIWSVRVGKNYRALAYPDSEGFTWFWIGSHAEYDKLLR